MKQNLPPRLGRLFFVAVVTYLLTSCANIRYADVEGDELAKQFSTITEKANIYIYRNQDVGINTNISVSVDGVPVGNTDRETFILTTVAPGEHTISAKAENVDELRIVTSAASNYFVWLEVRLGVVTNRAHLHLVDEDEGRRGVTESSLVY